MPPSRHAIPIQAVTGYTRLKAVAFRALLQPKNILGISHKTIKVRYAVLSTLEAERVSHHKVLLEYREFIHEMKVTSSRFSQESGPSPGSQPEVIFVRLSLYGKEVA